MKTEAFSEMVEKSYKPIQKQDRNGFFFTLWTVASGTFAVHWVKERGIKCHPFKKEWQDCGGDYAFTYTSYKLHHDITAWRKWNDDTELTIFYSLKHITNQNQCKTAESDIKLLN
jgi:hypothetical protein